MDDPNKTLAYSKELKLSGIPSVIGDYQVLSHLGQGGMGEVVQVKLRLGKDESKKRPSLKIDIKSLREEAAREGLIIDEEKATRISRRLEERLTETIPKPTNLAKIRETVSYVIKGVDPENPEQVGSITERDLEKQVFAMKLIPTNAKPEVVKRFEHEHDSLTKLRRKDKPNIVRIIEAGEEQGWKYYVMEFLPKEIPQGKISENNSIKVIKAVSQGLILSHSLGIVHRDIKPANVRLRVNKNLEEVDIEDIVITDFGIAKDQGQTTVTQGEITGTIAYISPERAAGEALSDDELKPSDIYSLGVMLYQFLTGELPTFGANHNAEAKTFLDNIAKNDLDLLPNELLAVKKEEQVDERLESIVLKMMARDRTKRYQRVKDVIEDLVRYEDVKYYEKLLLTLAEHKSENITVKELIGKGLNITIDSEFYELNINEAIKRLRNKVRESTPKAVEYAQQYLRERHLRKTAKRRFWTRLGTTAALTLALVVGGTVWLTHKSPADKRYESIMTMYDDAVEKEKQQNLDSLLAAEKQYDLTLQTIETDLREFVGDPREKDFKQKYQEAQTKAFEIDGEILRRSIEELRQTDPLSKRSDELQSLILNKLCEYKVRSLVNTIPEYKIPSVLDPETLNWNFIEPMVAESSHYPLMLLIAYNSTGNETYLTQFKALTNLIIEGKKDNNKATGDFNDIENTVGRLLKLGENGILRDAYLREARKLLTRFRNHGNFFQAAGFIDDESKQPLCDAVTSDFITILPNAFTETGDLDFWNLYVKHMNAMLEQFIKPDGSVYQAVGFAQKEWHSNNLNRDFKPGEVITKISYLDWRDQESVSSATQSIALSGFVKFYALSGDERALTAAKNLADFMIARKEPERFVWRQNIGKPLNETSENSEELNQRDTYASSLIAKALFELASCTSDNPQRNIYENAARKILFELSTEYLNTTTTPGLLSYSQLLKGVPRGVPSITTDANYLSALEMLVKRTKTADRFNPRLITVKKGEWNEKSGFLREKTGALAIDDRTILKIKYDDENLHLQFKCFYQGELTSEQLPNEDFNANDRIEITIDVPNNDQPFYSLQFTPKGIKRDSLGWRDISWNPRWDLKTEVSPEFWTAELVIPLRELNKLTQGTDCEFNVYRSSNNGTSSLGFTQKYFRNTERFERADKYKLVNAVLRLR